MLAANADNEYAIIDSSLVRAHQHSAGAQKSRARSGDRSFAWQPEQRDSRHGRWSMRSATPDDFVLTGSQAHDLIRADHWRQCRPIP
jgi:hypothetical protein